MKVILIVLGVVLVLVAICWIAVAVFSRKFDKEWAKMTPEERFKLQNDMRKMQC